MKIIEFIVKALLIVMLVIVAAHFLFPRAVAKDPNEDRWTQVARTRTDLLQMRYEARAGNVIVHLRDWQSDDDGHPLRLELFQLLVVCAPGGVAPATVGVQRHTVFDPVSGERLSDVRSATLEGIAAPVDVANPIGASVAMACAAADYARGAQAPSRVVGD